MNIKMLNFYINVYVNKIVFVISDALYANRDVSDALHDVNRDVSDPLNLMELGLGPSGGMYCLEADIENNIISKPRKNRF
jgi:hypothetical protein